MPDRKRMFRVAIAALLAVAVTAPAAGAMPIAEAADKSAGAPGAALMDMHASTVRRPAAPQQDLRTESSIAPSRQAAHASAAKPDLRTENAVDSTRAPEPPIGLPTWPLDPKPIAPVSPQPVAVDGDGGDIDWPIAALALAGALALGGGLAFAGQRLRTQTRPAH
jgi:hypothetical protein